MQIQEKMDTKALALLMLPICIFTCLFDADYNIVGLHEGSTWQRIAFHFFHANILHLLINWWAFVSIIFLYSIGWWQLLACFAVASLYPFGSSTPVIGLSGWVYALLGTIVPYISRKKYFLVNIGLSFLITACLPNIAVGIHIWCFSLGIILSYIAYARRG